MLTSYLKLALKVLARRKFFTFVSLFGICFTLVVLMVVTALYDHFVSPHKPETQLGRTLGVYSVQMDGKNSRSTGTAGYRFLELTLKDMPDAEAVTFVHLPDQVSVYRDLLKVDLFLRRADGNFWRVFDFDLIKGELYTQADEEAARFVAVINRSSAEGLFGGPTESIGQTLDIDGRDYRVIGVVEDVPFSSIRTFGDLWVPISTMNSQTYREHYRGPFFGFVLARSPADFPAMKAEFESRLASIPPPQIEKEFDTIESGLDTAIEGVVRIFDLPSVTWFRTFLVVIALLFMTLPAINLVNLNLSRILERASEIGVRRAFGARKGTLLGQFLVENLVLTFVGGILGLVFSALVLEGINATGIVPRADFGMNLRIFAWGMVMALAFGILSGVYPAWRMSRLQPVEALRGNS